MNKPNPAVAPWYKQPWLWFILTPLIAVFIYGFAFLYLSIITHDGIVKDDYYKEARGYHVDDSRSTYTRELGLSADIRLDTLTGDIVLNLSGKLETFPEFLALDIIHPTHRNYDQSLTLKQQPGTQSYLGSLQGNLLGKRYLALTDQEKLWRLRSEITVKNPEDGSVMEPIQAKLVASE